MWSPCHRYKRCTLALDEAYYTPPYLRVQRATGGAFASWGTSFGAEHAQRVPDMKRAPSRDRLHVGATHSEGARSVRTIFHQQRDIPHAHTHEECVALPLG